MFGTSRTFSDCLPETIWKNRTIISGYLIETKKIIRSQSVSATSSKYHWLIYFFVLTNKYSYFSNLKLDIFICYKLVKVFYSSVVFCITNTNNHTFLIHIVFIEMVILKTRTFNIFVVYNVRHVPNVSRLFIDNATENTNIDLRINNHNFKNKLLTDALSDIQYLLLTKLFYLFQIFLFDFLKMNIILSLTLLSCYLILLLKCIIYTSISQWIFCETLFYHFFSTLKQHNNY